MRLGIRLTSFAAALLSVSLIGVAQSRDSDHFGVAQGPGPAPAPEDRIDINHASLQELLKVPGMTESWARRVIRFRPYYSKLDLLEWGIVNSQAYDRIKNFVIAHRVPR